MDTLFRDTLNKSIAINFRQRKVKNANPKSRGWVLYRLLYAYFLKYFSIIGLLWFNFVV